MIIIRENSKPCKYKDLTPSIKIGNSHHLIAMRNANDRVFEQIGANIQYFINKKADRKAKR